MKYTIKQLVIVLFIIACNRDRVVLYDYSLIDINPSSITYNQIISPINFTNQVSVHYFGHQGWGLCQTRVGDLNNLYDDLLNEGMQDVKIIAIGKSSDNNFNDEWINGNSISIVVDSYPYNTWDNWNASQRDLFFLDKNGNYISNFNITEWDYNRVYEQIYDLLNE